MYYHTNLKFPHDPSLDNWENLGYKSRVDMVTQLVNRRTNPTIPKREDFSEFQDVEVFTLDGPATQTWEVSYSGVPKYWVVLGHEMDSRWEYPELRRKLVSGPERTCSHAEMVAESRLRDRVAIAKKAGKLRVSRNAGQ